MITDKDHAEHMQWVRREAHHRFKSKWRCLFGHDWTCDAAEGITMCSSLQVFLKDELEQAFFIYATTYCKCCGTVSRISQERLNEYAKK